MALLLGTAIGLVADDAVPGLAVFTLIVSIAITWRVGDPPVFPFIMAYQWASITVGFWFEQATGYFPIGYPPGDVPHSMTLALPGLLALAVGIRLAQQGGLTVLARLGQPVDDDDAEIGSLHTLFLIVVGTYAIDYLYFIDPGRLGSLNVIVLRLLDLRQVLLAALWFEVLRRRHGYTYLWLTLAWTFLPKLGAYFSDFKGPLVLLLIMMATLWRPWDAEWRPKAFTAFVKASPVMAILVMLLLVWQGSLKGDTREAYEDGVAGSSPFERVEFFTGGLRETVPDLLSDPAPYVESLVARVSYITFFSRVVDYVPSREPHAQGELLGMAVTNALVPRYFYPEKPALPSDSYYTRRFTGLLVPEDTASISIGYMAEFYADWGLTGMYLSVFCYGLWIGVIAAVACVVIRLRPLRVGILGVMFLPVADFEHQFIKGFGSLNSGVIFTLLVLVVISPWLQRTLKIGVGDDATGDAPPLTQPSET